MPEGGKLAVAEAPGHELVPGVDAPEGGVGDPDGIGCGREDLGDDDGRLAEDDVDPEPHEPLGKDAVPEEEEEAEPQDQFGEGHGKVHQGPQHVVPRKGETGEDIADADGQNHHDGHGDQAGEKGKPDAVKHFIGEGTLEDLIPSGHENKGQDRPQEHGGKKRRDTREGSAEYPCSHGETSWQEKAGTPASG